MNEVRKKPDNKRADLREACLNEALSIIGEAGVEGLSIRDVARRLGVSHQAPYKHFRSSDHLLAEVVQRTFRQFADALEARPRGVTPMEDLFYMGQAYLRFASEHPLRYRLIFGSPLPDRAAHPEMMQEGKHAFSILLDAVSREHGVKASSKPPKDVQLDALFTWATVHGLATILQTEALEGVGFQKSVLKDALSHTLNAIGKGISRTTPVTRCGPLESRPRKSKRG